GRRKAPTTTQNPSSTRNGAARSVRRYCRPSGARCCRGAARGRRLSDHRKPLGRRAGRYPGAPAPGCGSGRALPGTHTGRALGEALAAQAEQDGGLFVPVIARTRDDTAPRFSDCFPEILAIAAKAPADRLVRRLTAGLRVRTLHAT